MTRDVPDWMRTTKATQMLNEIESLRSAKKELMAALKWAVDCCDPHGDGELDRTKDIEHAIESAKQVIIKWRSA